MIPGINPNIVKMQLMKKLHLRPSLIKTPRGGRKNAKIRAIKLTSSTSTSVMSCLST